MSTASAARFLNRRQDRSSALWEKRFPALARRGVDAEARRECCAGAPASASSTGFLFAPFVFPARRERIAGIFDWNPRNVVISLREMSRLKGDQFGIAAGALNAGRGGNHERHESGEMNM